MRQGQQNRRGRGRGNNHNNGQRKGQNPLARSYESSGPDVKLRGTPAHIAEKYMALARDAQSSGDPVLAENYLQHAEHYNRIILAYREQQIAQGGGDPGMSGMPRQRPQFGAESLDQAGEFGDEDGGDDLLGVGGGIPREPVMGLGEQPVATVAPRGEVGASRFEGGGSRFEGRPHREQRQHEPRGEHHRFQPRERHQGGEHRGGFQDRGERHDRGDRPDRRDRFQDRDRNADRGERPDLVERERPQQQVEAVQGEGAPRRRERFQPQGGMQHEQPEFLRRPVRRPRREDGGDAPPQPAPAGAGEDQE